MTDEEAEETRDWRYADVEEAVLVGLAGHESFTAVSDDEIVGYCFFGPRAMIPPYLDQEHFVGVAWGLRPDLVGHGNGSRFVQQIVDFGTPRSHPLRLQAVIFRANLRSLTAALNAGFVLIDEVKGRQVLQQPETIYQGR